MGALSAPACERASAMFEYTWTDGLTDNPQALRKLVNEQVVEKGHAHSEDIVRDPVLTRWIDDYAQRLKDLTEPEWLKMIENPESRWYKERHEYHNLFKFGKKGADGGWQQ